jgi:ribose 5-phosphate isomerase B
VSISEAQVRELVRAVLRRTLGLAPAPDRPAAAITEQTVAATAPGSQLHPTPDQLITPLAREAARERGVTLVEPSATGRVKTSTDTKTVALGADHGGFELKQSLSAYLKELGYAPLDCGTFSKDAVDYPDFALAVAELVASGRAWRGIVVDGAGIGSCMAANKVPGIRAALCYDQATAVNSREHNDANVLTLGAGLIGPALAKQIVKTWLETAFGGGRHAKRVDKIVAIEKRFLK